MLSHPTRSTTSRTGNGSTLQSTKVAWSPQKGPQTALVKCPADEIFYGGARGGGKTDGMLGKFAVKASRYGEHCVGVFFRRSREDLKEAIERSQQIYGPIGAKWNEQKKWWRFPNGARLKFEYLDRDADADNYQGHNYTDVFFEELTHWASPTPVNKLRATLRSATGVPCQFHATGNPGGPGHQWVKARYISPAPQGWSLMWEDFTNPFTGEIVRKNRVFIPSKLSDNHYLGSGYVANLYQSGSKELVRAWLAGDWDVVEGAFFDCWDASKHVVRPFEVPETWARFRSGDWGSAKPFSMDGGLLSGKSTGLKVGSGCRAAA
ncbi:phage terminase large subunit [Bradyrhizobium sp. 2]|uniref:phage terminase large subunit n=1 Tax=Bradyrhizobium sp. 2 TaxID=190045 RepID=UPI002112434E|nr:phage terminase large subunit [Bradyrhizobium sp. 2]